jgi:heme A synthase
LIVNNVGLHRYAVVVALCVLAVVALGSLATTEGVSLSARNLPLALGKLIPTEPLADGVLLVMIHRTAALVGLVLTAGLTIWVFRIGADRALRRLALAAFLLLITEAVLGGVTVISGAREWVGLVHACVAQICFLSVGVIAFLTGPRSWMEGPTVYDYGWPSLRIIAFWTPLLVFFQIMLGALYRHHILGLVPHVVSAMIVTGIVLMFGLFTLTQVPKHEVVRTLATAVLLAMFVQLMLGFITYMSGAGDQATAPRWTALVTAGHVAGGGVLFGFCSILAIQVRRCVLPKLAPVTSVEAAL